MSDMLSALAGLGAVPLLVAGVVAAVVVRRVVVGSFLILAALGLGAAAFVLSR